VSDPVRSRQARQLAERALVRLVAAYGGIPEFVLLGGLVPDLLCSEAADRHVGTTDVDIQVDLEIQGGAVNAVRLEGALRAAGTAPAAPEGRSRRTALRRYAGVGRLLRRETRSVAPRGRRGGAGPLSRRGALGSV